MVTTRRGAGTSIGRGGGGALVLAGLAALAWSGGFAGEVSGFAAFSAYDPDHEFTDFINHPNDFPSWDKTTLTYKFDASFDAAFPNALLKDQVRLALAAWDRASAEPYGATYSYNRYLGSQKFGDIRTIAIHEIGHVLGLHHPDQADDVNRNFRPAPGGGYAAQADQKNEVLRSYIEPGAYNHILTHDELDGFARLYGHDLNFTEVASNQPADIVMTTYTDDDDVWAWGGWEGNARNSSDKRQGIRITSGKVKFNTSSGQPLGLRSLAVNWDYFFPAGKPIIYVDMDIIGTDNTTPLWHMDNEAPGHTKFNTFYTTSSTTADLKDMVTHHWVNVGGPAVPPLETLHVGVQEDVWDWWVWSARAEHPDYTLTALSLITVHEWASMVVKNTPPSPPGPDGGMTMGPEEEATARGFRLVTSDVPCLVSNLAMAVVDDLNLTLADLNASTRQSLTDEGRLEIIAGFGEREMNDHEDFYFILQGAEEGLPEAILAKGNYLILNRPDLLDHELFVYGTSAAGGATSGMYALLGEDAIVGIPEPATLSLLALGGLGMLGRRRRK